MFVHEHHYNVTEFDPQRPWVVVGETRRLCVELEDGQDFNLWAAKEWPAPRFRAELEPGELPPWEASG
ncbi:MAG: hypothetical protein ACLPZR_23690 [Solirubrobacteraceae bacterium]